ncbi:MAG: hypothetical protein HN725_16110 [Alphaproteobacteria bacterium]|jgi:hypothetical protein|nr:hypothetical protein [Alphaproteobacteria bacterium]MBT4085914.1 hypothetical protein [Alphaproteobacteria bacterium]MBT4542613.1 hypothetical protein [Alphaproteobacteria bacterium]MBT7746817.1 hypothetical protein [Alphaproteobacteria bacterium]
MSGKYTSAFDDMLASNEKQMNDVLGVSPASRHQSKPVAAEQAPVPDTSRAATSDTVSGTANGIPFTLKT